MFGMPLGRVILCEWGRADRRWKVIMASMTMAQSPTEVTDERLAEAARDGDRQAFASLVARYRDTAFAYAYVRTGNRDEAEDLAQEAFVRAFQTLNHFRTNGCWAAWLMSILRNLCHDAYRRKQTRGTVDFTADLRDTNPSPEAIALSEAAMKALGSSVDSLPEKYRTPLLLHYSGRQTYKEIALALELPESTIVGRMAGALRLLRRKMVEERT
jgi:RNA polymerase sigma-70 factor (ECF subfamily)